MSLKNLQKNRTPMITWPSSNSRLQQISTAAITLHPPAISRRAQRRLPMARISQSLRNPPQSPPNAPPNSGRLANRPISAGLNPFAWTRNVGIQKTNRLSAKVLENDAPKNAAMLRMLASDQSHRIGWLSVTTSSPSSIISASASLTPGCFRGEFRNSRANAIAKTIPALAVMTRPVCQVIPSQPINSVPMISDEQAPPARPANDEMNPCWEVRTALGTQLWVILPRHG